MASDPVREAMEKIVRMFISYLVSPISPPVVCATITDIISESERPLVEALKQAATALSNIRQYTTGLYASERNGTPSPKYFAMRLDNLADHGTRLRALLAERGIEC